MKSELELKKEILETGKRLYAKGLLVSTDGSISVQVNETEFLCTATGTNKGFMTLASVCLVDQEGNNKSTNGYRVTSAVKTHLLIHKERPQMQAVIHAYPMNATTFANAGLPLTKGASLEAINCTGCIPYVDKGLAATEEEINVLTEAIRHFDAILCGDIGVLAFGETLEAAYNKLESVELYATTIARSKELGLCQNPNQTMERELFSKRVKYGFTKKHPSNLCLRIKEGKPSCYTCSNTTQSFISQVDSKDLVEAIRKKVIEQMQVN
jgi:L-fuculose-phosphate aldolase